VGQTAIDAIIQGRIKRKSFKSFFDLVEHVDLRVVNKKVLESLIKCGAFDSMGVKRSQLFAVLEKALNGAGEMQKDRETGQRSFFDISEDGPSFKKNFHDLPDMPEWPDSELLLNEKEMLKFYVTGHPLARYRKELKSYCSASTANVHLRRDGEELIMGGLVSKLKFTMTKKNNEKMAIVGLEDLDGTIDLLVFPKCFKDYGHYLTKDAILFFKGNLDKKEQDPKLLVNEITPVANVHKKFTRSVHLKLMSERLEQNFMQSLHEILSKHPGTIPVYLEFIDPATKARSQMLVDRTLYVQPSENLVQALAGAIGEEAISLKI
jgi:DNA polymerase-3 subunit alpha